MADTTAPIIPSAQDLQINLEEAPKTDEILTTENSPVEIDLDLDLNLSEAPKNDDRLKTEDQKNAEVIPQQEASIEQKIETTLEQPATVEQKLETPVVKIQSRPVFKPIPEIEPKTVTAPIIEITAPIVEIAAPIIEPVPEPFIQPEMKTEIEIEPMVEPQPSTVIETETLENMASTELNKDLKIINELEGHPNGGGLAPEAVITPKSEQIEVPKTFDLDTMLGGPTIPQTHEMPPVSPQATIPQQTNAPVQMPAFTIPTTTAQIPVQTVIQTMVPKKNKGVKIFFFIILFIALGFTTFFILKTMYPIEFGNMFSGKTQKQVGGITTGSTSISTEITGTDVTGTQLTGTDLSGDQLSGSADTGSHGSAPDNVFGELSGIGNTTTQQPTENNVGKLTDYVTQGNNYLDQGKVLGNNTMIKFGLYISKKASTFLEKIANGEQINNLTGYFAQFDQYLVQLKDLAGQTPTTNVTGTSPEAAASSTPSTDGSQSIPTDTGTTTNSGTQG